MPAFAITHVSVLKITDSDTLADMTVVTRDGRIEAVAPARAISPPHDAIVIDGAGKFLLPGLCDMHVHISHGSLIGEDPPLDDDAALARQRDYISVFLAHGVTTIRNMAGTPLHLRLRAEVAAGQTMGPRIFCAGPILETRFTWPGLRHIGQLVTSPEQARAMVIANKRDGYDFIKVYNDIDADIYDALVETAREVGLKIIGHVAFAKGLSGALAAKQDSIEHLRSYDFAADTRPEPQGHRWEGWLHSTPARLAELAERTAAAGVWNVPTLVVEDGPALAHPGAADLSRLPEWLATMLPADKMSTVFTPRQQAAIRDSMPYRLAMVAALDRAGAKLMAGSDCPGNGLVPGDSLLRELEFFVAAGLKPLRALQTATIDPAEFLGTRGDAGTVEPGKHADLLLLEANPLDDISAIRRPAGVMTAGRWLPAEAMRPTAMPG